MAGEAAAASKLCPSRFTRLKQPSQNHGVSLLRDRKAKVVRGEFSLGSMLLSRAVSSQDFVCHQTSAKDAKAKVVATSV
jgi:hypothetical protein